MKKSGQGYKDMALNVDQLREGMVKAFDEKPIDTYIRKCEELAKKLTDGKLSAHQYKEQTDKLAQGLKEGGEAHSHAFGAEAVQDMMKLTAGALTFEKAIEFTNEALERQLELKKKVAEEATGGLPGAGELANVSPTPEAYAHNLEVSRKLMNQGIVPQGQESEAAHVSAGSCCRCGESCSPLLRFGAE